MVIYGEGKGALMSKDGQELVVWTGQGIGRFTSPGKIRIAGSLFFSTSSTGKLAFLNNLVGVFDMNQTSQEIRQPQYGNGSD